nr:ThiF family adenylyltransferase [Longimicrobium terrae]
MREVGEGGVLLTPRILAPVGGYAAALEGDVRVGPRRVKLRICLLDSFPGCLPHIYLMPWNALGFIPHVREGDGYICFLDPEGVILDRARPAQVVTESLRRTIHLLEAGFGKTNQADFVDEFEAHWSRMPGATWLWSILEPETFVRSVAVVETDNAMPFVAANESALSAYWNGNTVPSPRKIRGAVYLPLEPGTLLIPPRSNGPMWSVAEAREKLLGALSEENRRLATSLIGSRKYTGAQDVIVGLPRPSGGFNLFGVRLPAADGLHPLLSSSSAGAVSPLALLRLERPFLVPRGGADNGLASKRVLLIGCGAVGGHVALELARAGVLELTLVDSDVLHPENTFRHVLGRRYWFIRKAEALKQEIQANLPYVRVRAFTDSIESVTSSGLIDIAAYDIVICALGAPTLELLLNEQLHLASRRVIFTWVDPFGIGGHALLAGNAPGGGGCFSCLYTDPGAADAGIVNRASFAVADPAKPFGRVLTGCGNLHTPYGSLDAVRTASLATRLAIDALTGKEPGNPLRSWKGDPAAYLDAGFELSKRFAASDDQLDRLRYEYRVSACPVCSVDQGRNG